MAKGNTWPAKRWELTAPESSVLLNGESANPQEVFKVGLLELVTRGVFQMSESQGGRRLLGRGKPESLLVRRDNAKPPTEAALVPFYQAHLLAKTTLQPDGGYALPTADFVREFVKRNQSLANYVKMAILPTLVSRGLMEPRQEKMLFFFKTTKHYPTLAGEQKRNELAQWQSAGERDFKRLLDENPSQALLFASVAGPALLLMTPLYGDFGRLGEQIKSGQANITNADSYSYYGGDSSSSSSDTSDLPRFENEGGGLGLGGIDLGNLDFGFDFGAFDSIDSIDSVFDSIDSSISDAGGDSGGDGGD